MLHGLKDRVSVVLPSLFLYDICIHEIHKNLNGSGPESDKGSLSG